MSQKALKVWAEVKLGAVSCPGVRLSAKDDIFLSLFFMDQLHQSESLPAVFPLLFHQKMTFEKADIHIDHEEKLETVRIELVQLIPPAGDTLASYEEDARSFLFPEPKLVPPFSGLGREVLMMRAAHFRVKTLDSHFSLDFLTVANEISQKKTHHILALSLAGRALASKSLNFSVYLYVLPQVTSLLTFAFVVGLVTLETCRITAISASLMLSAISLITWIPSVSRPSQAASAWPAVGRSASPECSALFTSLSSSPLPRSSSTGKNC
uniref:Spermatogenesis associated 6-like protein n=1 Tax=Cyprinodon variegatus TaxID=28743 RepID=A0A3Q2FCM0_CYPVA